MRSSGGACPSAADRVDRMDLMDVMHRPGLAAPKGPALALTALVRG